MKFLCFNAHPDNKKVDDCVKRSLCVAEGIPYNDVSKALNGIKRSVGAKSYNSDKVIKKYISDKGYAKLSFPASKGSSRLNVALFAEYYPTGSYILIAPNI